MQSDFEALGPDAANYLKGLARHRRGGLQDQVRKILALVDDFGREAVHEAMARASSFGNYGYAAIKRILEKQSAHPGALPDDPRDRFDEESPRGLFIEVEKRDPEYYSQAQEEVAGS